MDNPLWDSDLCHSFNYTKKNKIKHLTTVGDANFALNHGRTMAEAIEQTMYKECRNVKILDGKEWDESQ